MSSIKTEIASEMENRVQNEKNCSINTKSLTNYENFFLKYEEFFIKNNPEFIFFCDFSILFLLCDSTCYDNTIMKLKILLLFI